MTPPPRRRGVTLIEAVIAMGLLAIFLAALVPVLAAGGRLSGTADEANEARRIAERVLIELARLPYEDPTDPGGTRAESGEGSSPADWDDIDDADG